MALISPLAPLHEQAEAVFIPYGPLAPAGEPSPDGTAPVSTRLVATFGEIEAEYASVRKAAAIADLPHRGVIEVTGADRRDFLERMVTNRLVDLAPGGVVRAFWLNRKGRIVSDLTLVELGDRMLIELDVLTVGVTLESLSQYLFSEDVQFRDVTAECHVLAVHGPRTPRLLANVLRSPSAAGTSDTPFEPAPGRALAATFPAGQSDGEAEIVVCRNDDLGEVGVHLMCPTRVVRALYEGLLEQGQEIGARAIGWHAGNIARIEAGTPYFLVDFGPDSLPHETGLLHERVSFKKGCYLGQEVVARMESLGRPKKILRGLKLKSDLLPGSGGQVYDPSDTMGEVIGAVTSATPSPMLGSTVVAFAMIRESKSAAGTPVIVNAEGRQVEAQVHELRFWSKPR